MDMVSLMLVFLVVSFALHILFTFKGLFSRTIATRAPATTTTTERNQQRPGGRLMQGISWLFNAFRQPPATKPPRPATPKTTPKPKEEEELLSKQPTHITPVVDDGSSSRSKALNSLTEGDLQKIIKQLEAIQKDPKNADKLDLTPLKNLQASNNKAAASNQLESVQIITPGSAGSRARYVTVCFSIYSFTNLYKPHLYNIPNK